MTCCISCSGNEGGYTLPSLILTLHIAGSHTLVCGGERERQGERESECKVGLEKVEKVYKERATRADRGERCKMNERVGAVYLRLE